MTKYCCSLCSYETLHKYNFNRHTKIHKVDQQVDRTVCTFCGRKYANISNCNRHMALCQYSTCNENARTENVAGKAGNVANEAENVANEAGNVADEAGNVADGSNLKCPDCYKVFSRMTYLNSHKLLCKKVQDPLMCPKCKILCTSRWDKSRHVAKCNSMELATVPSTANSAPSISSSTFNHCTVNMNTNNNNITNIVLNFGSEKTDHITSEQKDTWVKMLRGRGIMKLLEAVHFNPDVPENHNMLLDGNSRKVIKVFQNDAWVRRAFSEVSELLIANSKNALMDHYLNSPPLQEEDKEDRMIYTDLLSTNMDQKPNIYYKLVNQILCKIIDVTESMLSEET